MKIAAGIEEVIKKCFISVFDGLNERYQTGRDLSSLLENNAESFCQWIIEHYTYIDLFLSPNDPVQVDSLHVGLSFAKNYIDTENDVNPSRLSIVDVIQAPSSTVSGNLNKNKYTDIAILGGAGSGKTTTMKYLIFQAASGKKLRGCQRIPFFVALRDLKISPNCILSKMIDEVSGWRFSNPDKVIQGLIDKGCVLVVVDGIDEISTKEQKMVIDEIVSIKKSRKVNSSGYKPIFCITGRPYSFDRELSGFTRYKVSNLSYSDSIKLVNNWFFEDNKKSKELNNILKENENLKSFTKNPLMLSIVCALYNNNYDIPKREDLVIKKCLEGLLGEWDSFRLIDRDSALDSVSSVEKRMQIVSEIASFTFLRKNGNRVVFRSTDDSVRNAFNQIFDVYQSVKLTDPEVFLKSLYNDFGILSEESIGKYSFAHLKFQEYLTAIWLYENSFHEKFIGKYIDNISEWDFIIKVILRKVRSPSSFFEKIYGLLTPGSSSSLNFVISVFLDFEINLKRSYKKEFVRKNLFVIMKNMLGQGKISYSHDGCVRFSPGFDRSYSENFKNDLKNLFYLIKEVYRGCLWELNEVSGPVFGFEAFPDDLKVINKINMES